MSGFWTHAGSFATSMALLALFTLSGTRPVQADDPITIVPLDPVLEWPTGIILKAEVRSDVPIRSVRIESGFVGGMTGSAKFEPGTEVTAEYEIRTNASYPPMGAPFRYRFVVENARGDIARSDYQTYQRPDPRFNWQSLTEDGITIHYHDVRLEILRPMFEDARAALGSIGGRLGVVRTEPLTIVRYNSTREFQAVAPFESQATREFFAGVAYPDLGVILVSPTQGNENREMITHEIAHFFIGQISEGKVVFGDPLPVWLNEGLATYFQVGEADPGNVTYQAYRAELTIQVRTGQTLPLKQLHVPPRRAEQRNLPYSQGLSVVEYLVKQYGMDRLTQLLRKYGTDTTHDEAFKSVYGKDLNTIDQEWRASVSVVSTEEALVWQFTSWALIVFVVGGTMTVAAVGIGTFVLVRRRHSAPR